MLRFLLFASLLLPLLTSCVVPPETLPDIAPAEVPAPVMGVNDMLRVDVFMEDDLSGDFLVGESGEIQFPLIGLVPVAGLLPTEVASRIKEGLSDGFLNDPSVRVTVTEFSSRRVLVVGEVKSPGRIPYTDGMTLVQAITEAGGPTEKALLSYVRVNSPRRNQESLIVPYRAITVGRTKDFPLLPGDVVVVLESAVR